MSEERTKNIAKGRLFADLAKKKKTDPIAEILQEADEVIELEPLLAEQQDSDIMNNVKVQAERVDADVNQRAEELARVNENSLVGAFSVSIAKVSIDEIYDGTIQQKANRSKLRVIIAPAVRHALQDIVYRYGVYSADMMPFQSFFAEEIAISLRHGSRRLGWKRWYQGPVQENGNKMYRFFTVVKNAAAPAAKPFFYDPVPLLGEVVEQATELTRESVETVCRERITRGRNPNGPGQV